MYLPEYLPINLADLAGDNADIASASYMVWPASISAARLLTTICPLMKPSSNPENSIAKTAHETGWLDSHDLRAIRTTHNGENEI